MFHDVPQWYDKDNQNKEYSHKTKAQNQQQQTKQYKIMKKVT